jgi:hypothetical protein
MQISHITEKHNSYKVPKSIYSIAINNFFVMITKLKLAQNKESTLSIQL